MSISSISTQNIILNNIRDLVKKLVPQAIEEVSYGMPGFKYKGKYLIGYATFKNHMSLFPTPGPVEKLKHKLTSYKTSKGTIQFTLDLPLPDSLVKEIIQSRITEIDTLVE